MARFFRRGSSRFSFFEMGPGMCGRLVDHGLCDRQAVARREALDDAGWAFRCALHLRSETVAVGEWRWRTGPRMVDFDDPIDPTGDVEGELAVRVLAGVR